MLNLQCRARDCRSETQEYCEAEEAGLLFSEKERQEEKLGKRVTIRITNQSEECFCGVIHISVSFACKEPKFFMPGFLYGDNTADMPNSGRKPFPRIRLGEIQKPESPFWMTRSDRLALPVSLIYGEKRVVGISADPYRKEAGSFSGFNGFCCETDGTCAKAGFSLGYEDAPWLFIQTATVCDRPKQLKEEQCILLKAGETLECTLRIFDYSAEKVLGIHEAIKDVYWDYHEEPRTLSGMTLEKAAALLSGAIRDAAWLEEDGMYSGFVYDTPKGDTYNKLGSLSWTNGLAVAYPMLLTANRLQDEKMRQQALTFIEKVVKESYNPGSGLLYDAVTDGVWSVRGWWYNGMHSGGHSAYLNGQAIYYLLKSYLSEKQRGAEHPEWITFADPVVAKMNTLLNSDYEYPFAMSEKTGAALEYDSLGGAWCLAATALYSQITGEKQYLQLMKRSEQHYYDAFAAQVVCYGGPLDTDKAVDNEGILAFVRAARILHEMTNETQFLEHLRDGLYYECTYKLGYNTPVQIKPLKEIGWSSCGGSITSVANPHIHPMSSTIVDEMLYLTEHMEDPYLESRLKDTLLWGMQTFNTYDKEYGYGRVGWMSERFCFSQGLVVEKYPDGTPAGTWFALMPWASASILEGFAGMAWEKKRSS